MKVRQKLWLGLLGIIVLAVLAGFIDYPKGPDITWKGNLVKELKIHLGLDLQGGTSLIYKADLSQITPGEENEAMEGVRDVIERRINAFGVSEPVIQTNQSGGEWRVIVELPGVTDVNEAIRQIGETPLLEFKEEGEYDQEQKDLITQLNEGNKTQAEEILAEVQQPDVKFADVAKEKSQDPGSAENGGNLEWFGRGEMVEAFEEAAFNKAPVGEVFNELVETDYGWHILKVTEKNEEEDKVKARHILIQKYDLDLMGPNYVNTELSGKQLTRADVAFDPNTNQPQVSLEFDSEGGKLFGEITERNVGKTVAIYLDGSIISSPVVQEKIMEGRAVISGDFDLEEAKTLARRLNAGALPVPVELINQRNVGPTLGQESIEKSLFAGVIGLCVICLFMIVYYRLPGVLAVLALCIYGLLILAIFKLVPITLTLAGVAGFILSIGMAVDANVLIFERTKEELRKGKTLAQAVDDGFARAWLAIRDSNISTLITCLILAWFGTSLIKGFAITLAVGVALSMFSAITITRTFLKLLRVKKVWWFGVKEKKDV